MPGGGRPRGTASHRLQPARQQGQPAAMMARGRRPARCGSGGRDGGNPWTDPPDAGYCAQEAAAESRGTMVRVLQRLLRLGGRVTGLVLLPALAWADVETVHVSLEAYGI